MNRLERYVQGIPLERWFAYFFSHGCEGCPARGVCEAEPEGACCRDGFFRWALLEVAQEQDEVSRLKAALNTADRACAEKEAALQAVQKERDAWHRQANILLAKLVSVGDENARLQAEIERLTAALEQAERERDAAIGTMRGDCMYCAHYGKGLVEPCKSCSSFAAKEFVTGCHWQWRGPEKEG